MQSLGNFPDPFIAEIAGQPDAVRRAAAALPEQRDALSILAQIRGPLPVFTGMGSSYDACYPAAAALATSGVASVMLDSAELLHFRLGMLGRETLLVAVSQSGESAEVVRLVRELRSRDDRPRVVAVTNGVENALARLADVRVDTRAGEETGPSTLTFAASLVLLGAVASVLGGMPVETAIERVTAESERAASASEDLLANRALPEALATWLGDREVVVLLGRGPARAAAEMGALTLKEADGIPAESLETAQFRHGPLELAGPDLAAVIIATEPETRDLDLGLAAELIGAGAAVLVVAADVNGPPGAHRVAIGPVDRTLAPAVSILPVQLLAWRLAVLRGREPGAYTRASKVTTRE